MSIRASGIWVTGGLAVCSILLFAVTAAPQIVLSLALVLLAVISCSRRNALLLVATIVPILGFVRRLISGDAGRIDFDPLVATPILIVGVVAALGLMHKKSENMTQMTSAVAGIGYLFAAFVAMSVTLNRAFGFDAIYFSASIVIPLLLISGVMVGRIPDVWSSFERIIPIIAGIAGCYGVVQFFVLPDWDRKWMIASGLTSIGHPVPLEVRVFGMSESPGPYALFIGLAIVLCLAKAVEAERASGLPWYLLGLVLLLPLLLSGVRSALIGVMTCAALVVLIRGRGMGRVFPLGLIVATAWLADKVISTFDGVSSILNAERYTAFEVGSDGSVQARLGLFDYLLNPLTHVIGHPASGELDNLLVDILVNYGLVPMLLGAALMLITLVVALKSLLQRVSGSAALCSVFIFIAGFTGNFFNSGFGIVAGIVVASLLRQHKTGLVNRVPPTPSSPILLGRGNRRAATPRARATNQTRSRGSL